MIKTLRINIPYSETESQNEVLTRKLAEIGLTLKDIQINLKTKTGSFSDSSHYGNWCYLPALDIPELHKTDMTLDLNQAYLEVCDIENLRVGDRIKYTTYGIFGETPQTGRIFKVVVDTNENFGMIEVSKGKSKVKGYRFYTGDNLMLEKI